MNVNRHACQRSNCRHNLIRILPGSFETQGQPESPPHLFDPAVAPIPASSNPPVTTPIIHSWALLAALLSRKKVRLDRHDYHRARLPKGFRPGPTRQSLIFAATIVVVKSNTKAQQDACRFRLLSLTRLFRYPRSKRLLELQARSDIEQSPRWSEENPAKQLQVSELPLVVGL